MADDSEINRGDYIHRYLEERNCGDCIHWYQEERDMSVYGECRVAHPVIVCGGATPDNGRFFELTELHNHSVFPVTTVDCGCGEWRAGK